jgi:hypothetical protein
LKKSADSESFILVTGIMGWEEISRRILESAGGWNQKTNSEKYRTMPDSIYLMA